jgi:deoxyadenosine kinase
MEERDYRTYLELVNNMANFMRKPNLIIHLDVTPEESLRRIKQRGRTMELGITIDYLNDLHRAYEEFIGNISRVIPVIKVNWTTFADFLKMRTGGRFSVPTPPLSFLPVGSKKKKPQL